MDIDTGLRDRIASFTRLIESPGAMADGFTVLTLAGDASTRRYHRIAGGTPPHTLVLMELSAEPPPYGNPPGPGFINIHRYLEDAGFPVPRILRADLDARFIALEDLGDRTFEAEVTGAGPTERRRLYQRAADLIVSLQNMGRERPDPGCLAFGRAFDEKLLRWEIDHFREWFLEAERGVRLGDGEAAALDAGFSWLARALADSPRVLCHRDFQSRNLMIDAAGALRVIDFQDAMLGPAAYDLVALLRDSYVDLPADEVTALLDWFVATCQIDKADFTNLFHRQALQRKLKDAGRFVFLDRVRGNSSFRRFLPSSLGYIRQALREVPEFAAARAVLERHVPELS